MIRKIYLIGCLLALVTGCRADEIKKALHFVPIENVQKTLTGRCEWKKEYISFSNSGSSIGLPAPAKEFYIWIEETSTDALNANWFVVLSDYKETGKIQLKPGKHMYSITAPENSYVELVKATEAHVGEVRIYGLQLYKPYVTPEFVMMERENIQFIGNSITCGYGNMVSIETAPAGNPLTGFHTQNENAYLSYAMQTARNLNAAPTLVSFSGKGMYRNFGGDTTETLPKLYDRIHLQRKNSALWDHTHHAPDIIVINLGTNDYFGESQNKPLNDSVFVQTYIQFVTKLVKLYPNGKIICVGSPMLTDAWPAGKMCWTRLNTSIQKVQEHFREKGHKQFYTFLFTPQSAPYGEDYHPSLATHIKMAGELTTFIQTVVNK